MDDQRMLNNSRKQSMGRSKSQAKSRPRSQRGPRSNYVCHHCGLQGHTQPNCQKLRAINSATAPRSQGPRNDRRNWAGEPSRDRNGDPRMMDVMKMIGAFTNCLESFTRSVTMCPFKKAAVKGRNSKGKEHVIDVDDLFPSSKRTKSSSGVYDPNKFRTFTAFQTHAKYFRDAKPLLERALDQSSLFDTNIPKWFATKDWNYLFSTLDDAYENLVKEFYANTIVEGEELKCWVCGNTFFMTPAYLAEILHINKPMLRNPPVYDDLYLEEDLLWEAFGKFVHISSISCTKLL